jgi:hypothetical protein
MSMPVTDGAGPGLWAMTTYCSSYDDHAAARDAAERLLAAGVDGDDIRILMGAPDHDDDPTGGFAGSIPDDAPLGTFAGQTGEQDMGGFAGRPATAHRGGFATIDRETLTTFDDGHTRRTEAIGHRQLVRLLVDAGLDQDTAERDVHALHSGRALVLVRGDEAVEAIL